MLIKANSLALSANAIRFPVGKGKKLTVALKVGLETEELMCIK